ncbi:MULTISPECIES: BMC domain-containing protein [Halanaerobium]|uniref:Carboxysome shell and ethanolamine utilization microcompartment protein CcmL/EutN n=1 Tax=Halanaerobium kushneri TaxID=56779 RepID=A0A1N6QUI0_9FIRM|nr:MULTISPECIES: BMC domain-containing protein [Halanaerobium]RCW61071.1 microcompartment protein CcmL/EutN [Halanaerobium sp. ST460_2HS_T2]SIQ20237.1 Carboxysome shell and ethanolamine utilization microcompartment protein CcmL/EutN [Halanaerobium kushneri]
MGRNYGVLECKGRSATYFALNKMLKFSNVDFIGAKNSLGAGLSSVIISGNTAEINNALEIGKREAAKINDVLGAVSINNLSNELEKYILKKDSSNNKSNKTNYAEIKNAIALIEVFTFSAALKTADQVLKTTDVELLAMEKSKGGAGTPGLIVCLKFQGSNDALAAAEKVARRTAAKYYKSPASSILSNPALTIKQLSKEGI